MAPEAYSLEEALHTFVAGGSPMGARRAAAAVYDRIQHCGLAGALHLFSSEPQVKLAIYPGNEEGRPIVFFVRFGSRSGLLEQP
jgi:hypothetical protein